MADMRAERTRGYLREALVDLLHDKPFDKITVREAVERARVSRNSFYNHYADLIALVQDCYLQRVVYFRQPRKRLRDYASRFDAATETLDERARILLFFRENPNLARVILDNVCLSPYFAEVRHAEEDLLLDHIDTEYPDACISYLDRVDCARYIVWGMYGCMRAWFAAGSVRASLEDAVREAVYFALQSTAGMVGRPIEPQYRAAIEAWRWDDARR